MPKKTVDEFKRAFSAMKKPARPKNIPAKLKGALEKAVTADDETAFVSKIGEIQNLDADYLVELVAYKFGKHLETGKMPTWHDKVPQDTRQKALARILPGDMTDGRNKRLMDKAREQKDTGRIQLLIERDPAGAQDYFRALPDKDVKEFFESCIPEQNPTLSQALGKRLHATDPDGTMDWLLDEIAKANKGAAQARDDLDQAGRDGNKEEETRQRKIQTGHQERFKALSDAIQGVAGDRNQINVINEYLLSKNDDKSNKMLAIAVPNLSATDLTDLALKDPAHFIEDIMPALDSRGLIRLVSRPDFRETLAEAAPKEWAEFADRVPVLRLYDAVGEKREKDKKKGTGDKQTEQFRDARAIFDHMMDSGDTDVEYIGTNVGNPMDVIAKLDGPDGDEPPRTDCHNALTLLQVVIRGYPGLVPGVGDRLKHGSCPNMLMTKPLADIGNSSRGMIDKTFPGNVFEENGNPTGMILFTGENGVNSHSWLEAEGMAFDPVLGISGSVAEVKDGSTFQTFDWAIDGKVGKGGDWYFIVIDPENLADDAPRPKVAANKMSFSIGYILTKDPAPLLAKALADQL